MSECCYLGLLVLEVGLEVSPQPFDGLGLLDALPVDGQLGRVLLHGNVRLKSEKYKEQVLRKAIAAQAS